MNHQKEAAKIIEQVKDYGEVGSESDLNVSLAQAHALLAIAEQLRVGNLIAATNAGFYAGHGEDQEEVRRRAYMGLVNYMEDGHLTTYPVLNPEVAEALGIEQS